MCTWQMLVGVLFGKEIELSLFHHAIIWFHIAEFGIPRVDLEIDDYRDDPPCNQFSIVSLHSSVNISHW